MKNNAEDGLSCDLAAPSFKLTYKFDAAGERDGQASPLGVTVSVCHVFFAVWFCEVD